jgi:PAS domain-containing protein
MGRDTLASLRGRLEKVRDGANEMASARELEAALGELEVLWEELEQQADLLAAERQRGAFLFDHSPYACVLTDMHGVVREANRAGLDLFALPGRPLIGKPLALRFDERHRTAFRTLLAQTMVEPARLSAPLHILLATDPQVPVEVELMMLCLPMAKGSSATSVCFVRPTRRGAIRP